MKPPEALERIRALDDNFHEAGIFDPEALDYLIDQARTRSIRHSAETGCGVTILAMSWLSTDHSVFTLSHYGETPSRSYTNVRDSELLNPDVVSFELVGHAASWVTLSRNTSVVGKARERRTGGSRATTENGSRNARLCASE